MAKASYSSARDALSVRRLLQALAHLTPNQGERARRNARERVLSRLRSLREMLDEVYPAARRAPQRRKKRVKEPRLTEIKADAFATQVASAGIRIIPGAYNSILVPTWVAELRDLKDITVKRLRDARRSTNARRALLAEVRLNREMEVTT